MRDLTLVIPAKNEKESLPSVLQELKSFNLEILIVLEESDKDTINSISNTAVGWFFKRIRVTAMLLSLVLMRSLLSIFVSLMQMAHLILMNLEQCTKILPLVKLILFLRQDTNEIVVVRMIRLLLM